MAKSNTTQSQQMKMLIGNPTYWGLLTDYMAVEKDRLVIHLLSCEENDLKSIQGQLKALNKLEGLSAQLKTEESARNR